MSLLFNMIKSVFEPTKADIDKFFEDPFVVVRDGQVTRVDSKGALSITAFWACVRAISEDMGKLDIAFFQQEEKKKVRVINDVSLLVSKRPNPQMTSKSWRETMTHYALIWGNGISWIDRANAFNIRAIWPIHPDRTIIHKVSDKSTGAIGLAYEVRFNNGESVLLDPDDVFHLHGMASDGVIRLFCPGPVQVDLGRIDIAERLQ